MPSEISEFKNKIKALYTHIFQGTKELSIRKNDFVKQVRGEYGSDFWYFLIFALFLQSISILDLSYLINGLSLISIEKMN